MKKSLYSLFLVLIILSACGRHNVYINVLAPAGINVPQNIKTIAIINRTLPQNNVINVIEGVLTGEGLFQDKSGTDQALGGLNSIMSNSPRFSSKMTNVLMKGSGAGVVFPPPLDWMELENICRQYQTDAVCALETYDSNTDIRTSSRMVDRTDKDGKPVKQLEFTAEQSVRVHLGFRLYDPVNRTIVDQHHFTEVMNWRATGNNELEAIGRLINKRAATDQASYAAGTKYGARISPNWIRVHREYFKKAGKNEEFKTAFRFSAAGNWDAAGQIWYKLSRSSDPKVASKAMYNYAISKEVYGDLEEAKQWAEKSYSIYNLKIGRTYSQQLMHRIFENQRLQQQLNENNQ
ncbi:MAG: DUF6340 family protein [Cytophagaceae bacterium]